MRQLWFVASLLAAAASVNAQQPTRPAITGIAFMRVYTTDPAGADKFYGATLGYTKHEVDGLWIYPVNKLQWIEVDPHANPQSHSMQEALGFTTRDAAALEHYLEVHGVKPEEPLHDGQFSVRDPEGNLVIFVQSAVAGETAKAGAIAKFVAASPSSPNATSHRIIHMGFLVHDRAAEDPFWKGLLGFTPYWFGGRAGDEVDYVSQQVPNGTDWVEYMLNPGERPDAHELGSKDHFSLGVPHIQDALAALQRNHCDDKQCRAIQVGRDGKIQLNVFDPDLTRVEFMEFTPTLTPCCSPFTGKQPGPEESR